jgi:hypothetical protein
MPVRSPWRDPRTGQFRRDRPHPFSDFWPATTYVVVRLHPIVRQAVKTIANQQGVSVTHLVLAALEPVIRPVLPEPGQLQDGSQNRAHMPAAPHRLVRLADQVAASIPSQHNPGDALGQAQRRQQQRSRFTGTLTDTKR